jgi:hypothetical protein
VRRLIPFVAAALLVATPAGAAETEVGQEKGTILFRDERPGDVTRTPPASSGDRWHRYDTVLWDPAASLFCVDPRWTRNQEYAERQGRLDFPGRFDPATGQPRPSCPDDAVAAPSARQIAADVWQHVEDLPVPTLSIRPDYAITGKPVYLEIAGAGTWTRMVDNPIGDDVVITATSEYVIDWGDPTYPTTDVTRSQGGPYPDGDVTHVYTHESERTEIRVAQRWTATWRAGAGSGVLSQLTTESAPLVLQVRQLQAVRTR